MSPAGDSSEAVRAVRVLRADLGRGPGRVRGPATAGAMRALRAATGAMRALGSAVRAMRVPTALAVLSIILTVACMPAAGLPLATETGRPAPSASIASPTSPGSTGTANATGTTGAPGTHGGPASAAPGGDVLDGGGGSPSASQTPAGAPGTASTPGAGGSPTPVFQPLPRVPLSLALGPDPEAWFAHQQTKTWCAPSAVQMALAAMGLADTSAAFQASLQDRIGDWTTRADSRNGGWGPEAMARALADSGAPGYEVRIHPTRGAALRDAATALAETSSPVILLAWRGAHAWVMTGFRATADPARFADAEIEGAFILDPWYPWVSTIWGPSDPAGTFQDAAEMRRNFLPWKRPEGRYPDRDGKFVIVAPTIPVTAGE